MAVPQITSAELSMIKSSLALMFIRKVFERDAKILEQSGLLKSPEVYVSMIGEGIERVSILQSEVKNELRKQNIRIYRLTQDIDGIEAHYRCRKYEGTMRILWSSLRNEMPERMKAYLSIQPTETVLSTR
ncbi:putative transcriptional regulator [Paenibacillus shirakamiensis]|uniref:Transcriptional regulator n=1 Tax=Paenibacillus shirakamiensis TaxID=1265935 RepID=A0ABS4JJG2_9BACL|nr:hypothetical protein [Paenibacillus shirakamiensis]MBP2001256.1 putative transcriptional regulator [Paenibacillus shirakamiensis]